MDAKAEWESVCVSQGPAVWSCGGAWGKEGRELGQVLGTIGSRAGHHKEFNFCWGEEKPRFRKNRIC